MTPEPLPYAFAKCWQLVMMPATSDSKSVHIMHREDPTPTVVSELQRRYGLDIVFHSSTPEEFNKLLTEVYEETGSDAEAISANMVESIDLSGFDETLSDTHDLLQGADEAPIIRLINAVLSQATRLNASDVHIETFEQRVSVRFRVDGMLRDAFSPERELASMLVSRVKVMAKLDIAEKRLPQDGRMAIQVAGRALDVRVSTLPTRHGERLVLRLLEKDANQLTLDQIGFPDAYNALFKQWLQQPHGVILVTGPTGSGKSTTLYAGISHLNRTDINILTVEDPIEIDLDGIGQTQVNHKIDMSFAKGLRAILRQDPDVVMIGEIRDPETASIAVQASLTGHLVLSTLHTNTALGAIPRLIELGVEPFLLSSSLTGLLAQRLVRKLCPSCKEQYEPNADELAVFRDIDVDVRTLYRPTGCDACGGRGYKGRTAIYDFIVIDEALRKAIHSAATQSDWQSQISASGNGLLRDGLIKARQGVTTLGEVIRVAGEESDDNLL